MLYHISTSVTGSFSIRGVRLGETLRFATHSSTMMLSRENHVRELGKLYQRKRSSTLLVRAVSMHVFYVFVLMFSLAPWNMGNVNGQSFSNASQDLLRVFEKKARGFCCSFWCGGRGVHGSFLSAFAIHRVTPKTWGDVSRK